MKRNWQAAEKIINAVEDWITVAIILDCDTSRSARNELAEQQRKNTAD